MPWATSLRPPSTKLGRPVELTAPQYTPPGGEPVTPKSKFEYDAVGNVLAQIDELGNATRFTYDHLNQQIQIDAPSKTNDERALTKLTYTPNGDIESSTDPLGLADPRGATTRPLSARLPRRIAPQDRISPWSYAWSATSRPDPSSGCARRPPTGCSHHSWRPRRAGWRHPAQAFPPWSSCCRSSAR